ncbi:hypothetical protein Tsubulata_024257 [Turnera subulata]|uniref:Uncharacterized protein n=1 Tax=Turnera subulata TaxID=218843 RepID=A0A9Q0G2D9_9ROSI|nr:hypothetical protein Tsubulata_024257 [Turnera subulata]
MVMLIMEDVPVVQLIVTAALFLAAKSKETPRHLKNILRASCEILHKQDITLLSYMLPVTHLMSVIAADRRAQFEKLEYTEDDYQKVYGTPYSSHQELDEEEKISFSFRTMAADCTRCELVSPTVL